MGTNAAETPDYFADAPGYATHEVLNQAGALADYDAYANDTPLVQAIKVFGADWADVVLHRAGNHVGSQKVQYLARQANRHLPELRTHDRFGNRIDIVEFHPAYHELMALNTGLRLIPLPGPIRVSLVGTSCAAPSATSGTKVKMVSAVRWE